MEDDLVVFGEGMLEWEECFVVDRGMVKGV